MRNQQHPLEYEPRLPSSRRLKVARPRILAGLELLVFRSACRPLRQSDHRVGRRTLAACTRKSRLVQACMRYDPPVDQVVWDNTAGAAPRAALPKCWRDFWLTIWPVSPEPLSIPPRAANGWWPRVPGRECRAGSTALTAPWSTFAVTLIEPETMTTLWRHHGPDMAYDARAASSTGRAEEMYAGRIDPNNDSHSRSTTRSVANGKRSTAG